MKFMQAWKGECTCTKNYGDRDCSEEYRELELEDKYYASLLGKKMSFYGIKVNSK